MYTLFWGRLEYGHFLRFFCRRTCEKHFSHDGNYSRGYDAAASSTLGLLCSLLFVVVVVVVVFAVVVAVVVVAVVSAVVVAVVVIVAKEALVGGGFLEKQPLWTDTFFKYYISKETANQRHSTLP